MKRILLSFFINMFAVFAVDWATGKVEPPERIIIITIDTLRSDRLNVYGDGSYLTPNIDWLAEQGVVFEHCYSQIPLTGPCHISLMTSLYAHEHGGIRNTFRVSPNAMTLPEILSEHGYETAAFVSGWTLKARLSGLDRGFALYDDHMTDRYRMVNTQRFADETTDAVIQWLKNNESNRYFLWVHYFDPHSPYKTYNRYRGFADVKPFQRTPQYSGMERNYRTEIAFTDRHLGRFLTELQRLNHWKDCLIVLTSDHGESFGEHNYIGHGRRVYQPGLCIPLIIRTGDDRIMNKISSMKTQIVDIMPTVLDLAGIPLDLEKWKGDSLTPCLYLNPENQTLPERKIFFETYPGALKFVPRKLKKMVNEYPSRAGFILGDLKHILNVSSSELEIFFLDEDPRELLNHSQDMENSDGIKAIIENWFTAQGAANESLASELSEEDIQKLRQLGYIE